MAMFISVKPKKQQDKKLLIKITKVTKSALWLFLFTFEKISGKI